MGQTPACCKYVTPMQQSKQTLEDIKRKYARSCLTLGQPHTEHNCSAATHKDRHFLLPYPNSVFWLTYSRSSE